MQNGADVLSVWQHTKILWENESSSNQFNLMVSGPVGWNVTACAETKCVYSKCVAARVKCAVLNE